MAGWRKVAVPLLAVAAVGLPVNNLADYALIAIAAVVAFTGAVETRGRAWLAAAALVAAAIVAQVLLSPPRIEEGHNVFVPGPEMQRMLPEPVYRAMAEQLDALYPPAQNCARGADACWLNTPPDRPFAFSADGVWRKPEMSRAVHALDFTDPVWLRLGFTNEMRYNWYAAAPNVHRSDRDKRPWMGFARWQLAMPWYETIRLPAAFVGGQLCWRGDLLWEGERERFSRWSGDSCRPIEAADVGKRIFGLAIKPGTLAMQVSPPWTLQFSLYLKWACAFAAVCGVLALLVRFKARQTFAPFLIIGLAALVIAIDDASFLGGLRPFDGGDDGLFYDGVGRVLLQRLMAGDIAGFFQGGEDVFYYGGPGLRYFRALEHAIFGETYLGYLALVLAFPFFLMALFRRFLPSPWPLGLVLAFVAVPIGTLFGTSLVQYEKWASRGFADPSAYILFTAGIVILIGASPSGPGRRFLPGFFAALLFALGIFMKPIVAPAAAVLLGGAGLAALYYRQWPRLTGLCTGFLPVFAMALHNWAFGHVFVLFSSNSGDSNLLVMPPSAYVAALGQLLHGDLGGLARIVMQLADWLSNPAESYWTIPLNAAGVIILVWVVLRGRAFDPRLRLIGAAAMAQHAVAFFYNAATARYHFLTWLMTMLVVMVWFHDVGMPWLAQRYPQVWHRIAKGRAARQLASALTRLEKGSA